MGGSGTQYNKRNGLTREDIENAINKGDGDGYVFDVEYQKLQAERERLREEYERARDEYVKITEQLRKEMENGTASEADEARFMAMLTDRGVQLQQQQKKIEDSLTSLADQRADIDNQLAQLRNIAFSGSTSAPSTPAKPEEKYRGFKNQSRGEEKIVEMSPSEYLRRMAFQFGNGNMESLLRTASPQMIEKIARQMRRGIKFNSPTLDYSSHKTTGNERAIAALLNGYKRIPVLIIE